MLPSPVSQGPVPASTSTQDLAYDRSLRNVAKIDLLMKSVLSNHQLTNDQLERMAGRIWVAMDGRGLSMQEQLVP